jgi:outer membrane lipoprotein-sorting protein
VADGGIDMTDLQGVIGLLYRADWTGLSLAADVRSETDQDLLRSRVRAVKPSWVPEGRGRSSRGVYPEGGPPTWADATSEEPGGYHSWHARLLIAPGGRYRQEYLDEPSGRVIGSDGERSWVWHQQEPGPPIEVRHRPPLHQLLRPSELLGDFTLEVRGPVTACGREGIAVVATPRTGNEYVPRLNASTLSDHLEVIVDAELGILLRYEEAFAGQRLSLTELTAVVLDPPEVADLSRFAPPAGSRISQDPEESLREKRSGPGWEVEKTVVGLATGGLGAALRFASRCPGRPGFSEDDLQSAMPPAEPAVLEAEGGPPPPDDLLYLLYQSGENPAFTATRDQWQDLSAMMAQLPDSMRAMGYGGFGYMIDSLAVVTRGKPVAHTVSRLRVAGRDKYRLDYLTRSGRNRVKTIACDGEHRWVVFAAQIMVGPAHPLSRDLANVVDSSWLLGCRLSGGAEVSYRGRRAYQLSVSSDGDGWQAATLPSFPADAIVDAELGCLLRLISFAGDRPASWYELSGIGTEPVPTGEFRLDIPPGVRVVEATGNPFTDSAAVMPGAAGTVVRTAVDVVRRTSDAVSATRSFLDDLRGRSPS